jgi:hypothetical protein
VLPVERLERFSCCETFLSVKIVIKTPLLLSVISISCTDCRLPYLLSKSPIYASIVNIFAMPDDQYCEPCKRFLWGKTQFRPRDARGVEFDHHSLSWQESISCGTIGLFRVQFDSEKCIQFRYGMSKYETYELASHDILMML